MRLVWRAGMILERLNGHGANKPITPSDFKDVNHLQEMLCAALVPR
jgi:hypothetical protein